MLKKTRFFTILFAIAILVMPAIAQTSDEACYNRGGFINDETGRCTVSTGMTIDIQYPIEVAAYPFAQDIVDDFLSSAYNSFIGFYTDARSDVDFGGEFVWFDPPWNMGITYEMFDYNPFIFGIKFDVYEYTGGAHGNVYFKTFTFDNSTNSLVTLNDLFTDASSGLETVATLVREDLATREYFEPGDDWMLEGTAPTPENYSNFTLSSDSLTIYFPPYQVGPYAMGPQQVSIPLTMLDAVLAPRFR